MGSPEGTAPDAYAGTAIFIEGGRNITIRNARIQGFKIGIHAYGVERLTIENCDLSGNWRQRLNSTPDAEAPEVWLYGHQNDDNEWLRYGADIYLDRCPNATIARNLGRNGQNGICMTRSQMARASSTTTSRSTRAGAWRCIAQPVRRQPQQVRLVHPRVQPRGPAAGRTRRGSSSEQCSDNVFAYNSATHGGDGFFLWAGHETLDKTGEGGCNRNLLYRNDFSHAAANGIEATFSVGNKFIENRLEECDHGVWAGYSTETLIAGNSIARCENGISIEHGNNNKIEGNTFEGNGTAIHLWWDEDPDLFKTAYGTKRNTKSENYVITGNTFRGDKTAILIQQTADVRISGNNFVKCGALFNGSGYDSIANNNIGDFESLGDGQPLLPVGKNWWKNPSPRSDRLERPVEIPHSSPKVNLVVDGTSESFLPAGALRGRKYIFVDEWGPRDPADPMIAEERAKQTVNLATGWKLTFHTWEAAGAGKPPADWDAVKSSEPVRP
jgi:parallel beta-helix repeat protein